MGSDHSQSYLPHFPCDSVTHRAGPQRGLPPPGRRLEQVPVRQEWGWKVGTGSEKDSGALVAGRKRVEAKGGGQGYREARSLLQGLEEGVNHKIKWGGAVGVGREDSEFGGNTLD